jgi:phosphatidate phosphatase APP1
MSTRPFFLARVEESYDRKVEAFMRRLRWREQVVCYTGYGSSKFLRVLGRVTLVGKRAERGLGKAIDDFAKRRGIRNFVTIPCVSVPYTVTVGGRAIEAVTDRGGYIDLRVRDHGLAPGWHLVQIRSAGSEPRQAPVMIVPDSQRFGIVSDVDDTVIATWLPRPLLAAWNSFIRNEYARQAIPGMAQLYRTLLGAHENAPVFYISTGAWNTQPFLTRFLARHRFPAGPTLLTDWGPTNTGFFRSGLAHKANTLLQLNQDFPNIDWLLVGDNGQHDPSIYSTFARIAPERVRAVAIRQLSPTEQVLAHGSTESLERPDGPDPEIPWVEAPDGRGLLRQLGPLLGLD